LEQKVSDFLDLGATMGQNQAFGAVAGRCSAAQAAALQKIHDEEKYKLCGTTWEEFCSTHLKISRHHADQLIRLYREFGPRYFELAQFAPISAETYRALEPAVKDGALELEGGAIPLTAENAPRVAEALRKAGRRRTGQESQVGPVVRCRRFGEQCRLLVDEVVYLSQVELTDRSLENFLQSVQWVYRELGKTLERFDYPV